MLNEWCDNCFFPGTVLEAVSFKRIDFFIANILKSGRHFEAVTVAISHVKLQITNEISRVNIID